MHESTRLITSKRPRSATAQSPTGRYPQACKRQKLSHPHRPPPEFWDRLTQQHLTKRALSELDRRNRERQRESYAPSQPRHRRPITRAYASQSNRNQATTQSAEEYLASLPPAHVAQIRRFARFGGPDLSDLKGYQDACDDTSSSPMSSRPSSRGRKRKSASPTKRSNNTPHTTSTKSTGPYDRAFQQHLIDHGIFPHRYEYPNGQVPPAPDNLKEIVQVLAEPRRSLSPSVFTADDFQHFERADSHATKESQVMSRVIPIVEGNIRDNKCVSGQVPFTNLDPLTDGTLVPGNPDRYFGARPEQLDRRIRSEIGGLVVPSTQEDLPIVPNFLLAVKGPDGSAAVAKRQASYDGALGARSIQTVQAYGGPPKSDHNNAFTITSTYHDGHLKMYTVHPSRPSGFGKPVEYFMTQIKAFALTSDVEAFRAGAAAYRNGRDWAKRQRDDAITEANEKTTVESSKASANEDMALSLSTRATTSPVVDSSSQNTVRTQHYESSAMSPMYDSETSADELGISHPAKRSKLIR